MTETSLDIFEYFKLQSIFNEMYLVRCNLIYLRSRTRLVVVPDTEGEGGH